MNGVRRGTEKGKKGASPDGPVLENLPSNEGRGFNSRLGTKIQNDLWLLNLSTTTKKPVHIKEEPTVKTQKQRGKAETCRKSTPPKVKSRAR